MSRNRLVAYVFGAVYLLIGILGWFVLEDAGMAGRDTEATLLGFDVNGLHNIVHLLVGAALLWAARAGYRQARSMNLAVGATYALVGIIGLFIATEDNEANILNLNGADNVLHLLTAAVLLAVAMMEKNYVEVERERDRAGVI